ncbi:hypothetical protein F511_02706 [Dorcoceras hygrometricum]|uniref:Uncharacterized protein n=1 Tax=Dorcoceras hygrometricum TaxID=472368 RepID=A0A2Z7CMV7_9LAMI|nr:hypothetical protein F511_02706 [Dorcoceras hygrometricum]
MPQILARYVQDVNISSTRTSALKFYLNISYSGMAASTAQTCYLTGHVQHSRDFPGAQIQKLKRAEELSGLASRERSSNTATLCSLCNVASSHLTGINRKSYSRRAQRHQSRSKQRRKSTAIYQ